MTFKKGDKVIMTKCTEAEVHKGRVWECADDSFQRYKKLPPKDTLHVVYLKGYDSAFWCKYLKKI